MQASLGNSHPTLVDTVWKDRSLVRNIVIAIVGSLLLYASAKIKVPFYPVPMTMQTLVVLMIGMVCGWRLGMATVALYLVEGALGLPVFSGTPERGIGLVYMTGPTGGYLVGFLFAAGLCGWLAEKGWDRNMLTTFAAMVLGTLLIYACGVYWLGTVIGLGKAFEVGMRLFLWGDLLKVTLAMLLLPTVWKLLKK